MLPIGGEIEGSITCASVFECGAVSITGASHGNVAMGSVDFQGADGGGEDGGEDELHFSQFKIIKLKNLNLIYRLADLKIVGKI